MVETRETIRLAVVGQPLAGKTATMQLLARATGATLIRRPANVPSGWLKGAPFSLLELMFPCSDARSVYLRTAPGGVPIEANELALPKADLALFVVHGRADVRDRDLEWWQKLSAITRAPWMFAINRRPGVDTSAAELLAALGLDPATPCLDYSALAEADGHRLQEFICTSVDRLLPAGLETPGDRSS